MIGINNNSCICYINVCIQLLYNNKDLINYMNRLDKKNNKLIIELTNIFELLENNKESLDIDDFLDNIQDYAIDNNIEEFQDVNQQNDANEFLFFLFDIIHKIFSYKVNIKYIGEIKTLNDKLAIKSIKSLNKNFKNEYSFLVNLFYGQYISIFDKNIQFEPFNQLLLNLDENTNTIFDCVDNFIKNEKINDKIKKMSFWYFPNYLIICFNRFIENEKNEKLINYPINNFNLNSYSKGYKKNNIFNLISVINHSGSINFGHYYMYNIINNEIYLINDNIINKVDKINKKDTYMLVYKKLTQI